MVKHYKALIAILAIFAFMLTGCTKKNEVVNYEVPKKADYGLSFFGNKHEAANVEVIEYILNGYMEENEDVMVSYESLKGDDYYSALQSREATGHLDDVFMVNHDTTLEFSAKGSLADLSELVRTVPFSESMLSQMKSEDGNIYWVPTTVSAFGLYCNLDLLKQHGQPVPENLKEWRQVCGYFVSKGIIPIIANNDISLKTLAIGKGFYPLYKNGQQEEAFDKLNSGKEKLSTYLKDGFAIAQEFCEKKYIDAEKALKTEKTSDDLEQFVEGESPFMLTGVWAAGRVKGMEPDFDFKVIPYPILEKGAVLVINPDVRLSVAAKGNNTELAKEFVSYFLKKDNIGRLANNQSSFSPLKGEHMPVLSEVQSIVDSYQTQASVIGADSYIDFPIWDITSDAAKRLLAGEKMATVMRRMDKESASK